MIRIDDTLLGHELTMSKKEAMELAIDIVKRLTKFYKDTFILLAKDKDNNIVELRFSVEGDKQ